MAILKRQPLFPHVIELNHQARRRISCSVYLIYDDDNNWTLIDIGYEDAVDDCLEIIRQLDFPFSKCVTLIASHADVDHIQGFAKAKQLLKTTVTAHPLAAKPLETGDKLMTYAEIAAQDIHLEMPTVKVEQLVEGRRQDQASATWNWRSGTRRATRPASFRSGSASCCFRATTCFATAASAPSMPTTAAAFGDFIKSLQADSGQRRRMAAAKPRAGVPQGRSADRSARSPGWKPIFTWPISAPVRSTGR